jgi:hypothetical protein
MKVTIRRNELLQVLSAYFRIGVDDFVIGPTTISELGKKARIAVNKPLYADLKISNIKALRELSTSLGQPLTLMEGKWALEHWVEWVSFLDEYNRLPEGGYASQMTYGQLR